jgi:amidase
MHTLADLIEFNIEHCPAELVYYGQEIFELAESTSGDLTDPVYVAARTHARNAARSGIDNALARDNLDAIVAPHLTNSTGPAVAGYPDLSIPVGIRSNGRPAGMLIYSTFLHEPQLIGFGYDLEQALHPRRQPQLLGPIPTIPTADLCDNLPKKPHVFKGKAHLPHGRIF